MNISANIQERLLPLYVWVCVSVCVCYCWPVCCYLLQAHYCGHVQIHAVLISTQSNLNIRHCVLCILDTPCNSPLYFRALPCEMISIRKPLPVMRLCEPDLWKKTRSNTSEHFQYSCVKAAFDMWRGWGTNCQLSDWNSIFTCSLYRLLLLERHYLWQINLINLDRIETMKDGKVKL